MNKILISASIFYLMFFVLVAIIPAEGEEDFYTQTTDITETWNGTVNTIETTVSTNVISNLYTNATTNITNMPDIINFIVFGGLAVLVSFGLVGFFIEIAKIVAGFF